MAIRIITGAPGGGKTFYAVKHLRDNYLTKAGKVKKGHTIISNVEGLKVPHIDLDEAIKASKKDVNGFFTVDYQKKITEKYPGIVYMIDEAQKYFHKRFYDKESFFYFQYHRHIGHDIYLICQSSVSIPTDLRVLAEHEIHAVPRMLSIFGEFKYRVISGNQTVDHKMLRKNKAVFRLYKSMDYNESEKIRNPFIKYGIGTVSYTHLTLPTN